MASSVPPEQPIIRPAMPDDVDQIAPLFLTSLDTSLPGLSFSTRPEYALHLVRAHLAQRLFPPAASSTFVLVFPSSGDIVGYANVREAKDNETPELDMLFVKPEMEGRSYGGKLLRFVQKQWENSGLQLHVFKRNEKAVKFYEKRRFETVNAKEVDVGGGVKEKAFGMRWVPGNATT